MPAPDNIEGHFDAKNGFYKINKNSQQLLRDGIAMLSKSLGYDKDKETVSFGGSSFGKVTKALQMIHAAKLDDLERVVRQDMKDHPNGRFIINVDFLDHVNSLAKRFSDMKPAIMVGATKDRTKIVKDFKNNKIKLLIKTSTTGNSAISLHDTDGGYPRFMYYLPNYSFITIAQNVMRIYRDGSKSDATVRMFYGKGEFFEEKGILKAMASKTEVVKGMIDEKNLGEIVYPGDYPDYIEV
jgi:hypothetical protein